MLVLADAGRSDFVLCQVTSNQYGDPRAIELDDDDFVQGSLDRVSYVRPGKLFTELIGASTSTVRAWEQGVREPSEMARRLIALAERDPQVFAKDLVPAGSTEA